MNKIVLALALLCLAVASANSTPSGDVVEGREPNAKEMTLVRDVWERFD